MSGDHGKDVIDWQNAMRSQKGKTGKTVSPTYLKTIHGQLSSIFNHAIRYYDLNINPARKAGTMGTERKQRNVVLDERRISEICRRDDG